MLDTQDVHRQDGRVRTPTVIQPDQGTSVVRVLVADRDELYLSSLASIVARDPGQELVGDTTDGFDALNLVRSVRPAVAVLDPGLPGIDGLGILNAIERDQLPTRTVFLSGEAETRRPYEAIAAGARGYITRLAGEEEICAAITAAAAGGVILSPQIHSAVVREIRRRSAFDEPPLDPGTREVIELTAAGFSPSEIGYRLHLSATTVKSRLHSLYRRLGVRAPTAAVAEAIRRRLID
jgi:two-component system nitrate/nitrite response regulator NarL